MISVCLASHNGGRYIELQLQSILQQLGPHDEIIISDDGSTDNTLKIIEAIKDHRIRVVYLAPAIGKFRPSECVGRNFENAIKHSRGDIIFLSDQDDIWVENKVTQMLKAIDGYAVCVSNAWRMYDQDLSQCTKLLYTDRKPIHNYYLRRGKPYGCCMAFRKEILKYILPFPSRLPLHDYWIGLIAELMGGAVFIDEPLIYHRYHVSNTSENTNFPLWYKCYYRLRLLVQIYLRVGRWKVRNFLSGK